jgi:hypothetical protein
MRENALPSTSFLEGPRQTKTAALTILLVAASHTTLPLARANRYDALGNSASRR